MAVSRAPETCDACAQTPATACALTSIAQLTHVLSAQAVESCFGSGATTKLARAAVFGHWRRRTIRAISARSALLSHNRHSAGIFYDDPTHTPPEQCRSRAAVELPTDVVQGTHLPSMTLERQPALKTTFPYFHNASVFLALMKVYPALKQACADTRWKHGYCVEVYDRPQQRIEYYDLRQKL